MLRASVLALLLVVLPSLARADIYMWRDPQGVTHYTNAKALVPTDAGASVVLEEPPPSTLPEVTAPAVRAAAPPREVPPAPQEDAFDQGAMAAAYAAGWQQGLAAAQQMRVAAPAPPAAPVSIQFNAPLAVAVGGGDGGYAPSWLDYNYPALVTTSFDNGRSRHLTLRMLLQDQFAIDREAPYLIVDRFPPRGPNLQTVLPRGLPVVSGRLGNRVLNH